MHRRALVVLSALALCLVAVSGAVLQPGPVPLNRPMTAMEAVLERGGFDPVRAKPSKVVVLRQEEGRKRRRPGRPACRVSVK